MKNIVPALAAFVVLAGCAGGPATEKARRHMDAGDRYFTEGDYEAALECYDDAVKANPREPLAYLRRGNANVRLARDPEGKKPAREHENQALANYIECVRLNPSIADAFFNRAMIYAKRANYKQAVKDLMQYSKLIEKDPEPHLLIGQMYEERFEDSGLLVRAMEHYEKYLELGGRNPVIEEKVRTWQELKKAAGLDGDPKKPDPEGKGGEKPKEDDEAVAQKLFDTYRTLFVSGNEEKKKQAMEVLRTLVDKYAHTEVVKSRPWIRTLLRGRDEEEKPPDKP